MKRYWGHAIAALLIILTAVGFTSLKDFLPFGRAVRSPASPTIALRLDHGELVGKSHGNRSWRFKARSVEVSRDRSYTVFTGIRDGVVYNNNRPALKLSAHRIIYDSYTEGLRATGRISVAAEQKLSLTTDSLTWDPRERKLICPSRVTIVTAGGKGSAGSLSADLKNNELILRDVNLNIPADEDLGLNL